MSTIKSQYELSIWDDKIHREKEGVEYFKEEKLATISSNKIKSPTAAYNITLNEDTAGNRTLSFDIARKYRNSDGELVDNPYLNLLVNERKIKIRDGIDYEYSEDINDYIKQQKEDDSEEKWLDFVIKSVKENKQNYTNSYTAKELFVNELGKNGWAVTLDTELENNYGTINELGERILEGSGWIIGKDSYIPPETTIEPLFITTTRTSITGKYVLPQASGATSKVIPAGSTIYIFYSDVQWNESSKTWVLKDNAEVQLLYSGSKFGMEDADDNRVIMDNDFEYNFIVNKSSLSINQLVLTGAGQQVALQGTKIVQYPSKIYDDNLDRYVDEYEVINSSAGAPVGTKVRSYVKNDYLTSEIVKNLATNNTHFVNTSAWSTSNPSDPIGLQTMPIPSNNNPSTWLNIKPTNYLALPYKAATYYNSGLANTRVNLVQDSIYVVRIKARSIARGEDEYGSSLQNINRIQGAAWLYLTMQKGSGSYDTVSTKVNIANANVNTTSSDPDIRYYGQRVSGRTRYSYANEGVPFTDSEGYIYGYIRATRSTNILNDGRVYLTLDTTSISSKWDLGIEDIQIFEYHEDINNAPIFFGDIPTGDIKSTRYFFRNLGQKDNQYLSSNEKYYKPSYRDGYASVRHVSIKGSNYFNNINTLAELFEVWVKFKVHHCKDGTIKLDSNKEPIKEVIFSKYSPNGEVMNWSGFKYGVNIQNIQRTIDSNGMATKTIVKNNNQKYAKDGMASISRAHSNPTKDNEIIDFNYYINQGLLDYNQVLADLYGMSSSDLSYYYHLNEINTRLNKYAELSVSYKTEVRISEGFIEMYDEGIAAADKAIQDELFFFNGYDEKDSTNKYEKKVTIMRLEAQKKGFATLRDYYERRFKEYTRKSESAEDLLDSVRKEKNELKAKFYKKYARFIQEGVWTDEKYIDDNLYYLDALKVSSVSAFPKVSYQLGVLNVEELNGYEAYSFKIGHRTYIQDTDFFGWINKDISGIGTVKTPFKMDVVVTNKKRVFDDPSKTTITIKNYKNQYEEIFQKMVSTTTNLQFQEGAYNKVTDIFDPMGEIDITSLEEAMKNNAFVLGNSSNQQVVWDSGRGIEITDTMNTSLKLRLVAGGLFMTTDGGRTWMNGINGSGINTKHLVAGQIDASKINITTGLVPSFRWDAEGVTSFYNTTDSYDATRFVRFNQYGIFGTTNGLELNHDLALAESYDERLKIIKEKSNFSLTWDGMTISYQDGAVSLGAVEGLEIFNPNWLFPEDTVANYPYLTTPKGDNRYTEKDKIPLVSLGKFYDLVNGEPLYGLRMRNKKGEITLKTNQEGNLWLANELSVGVNSPISITKKGSEEIQLEKTAGNITFTVSLDIAPAGTITNYGVEGNPSYVYNQKDYYKKDGVKIFRIPVTAFDTDSYVLPNGVHNHRLEFPELVTDEAYNYRYMKIQGKIDEAEVYEGYDPAILYAGHLEEDRAPFKVYASGKLEAREALISGEIHAKSGSFDGKLSVGKRSGIDGDINATYTFWAGEIGEVDEDGTIISPNFYVTPDGKLYGRDVIIEGNGSFSGIVNATGGNFKGKIEAESGSILGAIYFGNTQDNYIGSKEGSDLIINMNDNFKVNTSGDSFMNSLMLSHNPLWANDNSLERQYNILIGDKASQSYIFEAFNPVTDIPQEKRVFGIARDGSLIMGGNLVTNGDLTLSGRITSPSGEFIIDGATGSIKSKIPEINGWGVYEDGSAHFSNASIRGKIESAVFSYNEKSSVGGDLLVSPTMFLTEEVVGELIGDNYVYTLPVVVESNVWINIDEVSVNINGSEMTGTLDYPLLTIPSEMLTYVPELKDKTRLPMGTQIISTSTKTNSILLSAKEVDGSFISMRGPRHEPDIATVLIGNLTKTQLPNSATELFGDNLGYGLYANNAFLTGQLYLPNAGVTNEESRYYRNKEEEGKEIRFWAGTSGRDMENAPFIVTQDGSLYASRGIFSGIIEAENSSFSGYLETAGILINEEKNNHFYVTRPFDEDVGPTKETYIIDISEKGLDIWEGGLNIYSDYYAGWRGKEKLGTPYPLYGYDEVNNPNPWVVFTIQDKGYDNNHIPHISTVHQHVWFKDKNNKVGSSKIYPGYISFDSGINASTIDYNDMEKVLWESKDQISFGMHDLIDQSIPGIKAEQMSIHNGTVEALVVTPKHLETDTGHISNLSQTKVRGFFNFGDVIQVSQEPDGIIFTYIGKE